MITAGEVLKNKRESLGKSLEQVSVDTKIQKRFLEQIEDNQYDKFDSDIFVTGFIKIYSKYLGLDTEKILAVYRRSNPKNGKSEQKDSSFLSKKKRSSTIRITPQLIAILTIVLFVFSVVGYVGYQIYKFQRPPQLEIISPTNEYVSEEDRIIVKGTTDSFTTIEINSIPIDKDDNGYFEQEVELNIGINTISIKAKKNSNTQLETTRTVKVIYQPENNFPVEQDTKEFKILLSINSASAWIKLDVDNINQISQILEPNTEIEFVFEDSFFLSTGRVQNTELRVNGEIISISSTQNTGVGQITCQIIEDKVECN
jgi:cytoskeletal protein RodZ